MAKHPTAEAIDKAFSEASQREDKRMAELVEDIAQEFGVTERQIYNYRSGKWAPKRGFVVLLQKRFKESTGLEAIDLNSLSENPEEPEHPGSWPGKPA